MPTTEILTAQLKPGGDIGDPGNEAAVVIKDTCDKLSGTKGVQQIHFGMQIENPAVFRLVVTWDKLESHQAFMGTEEYKPFLARFQTVMSGALTITHADINPEGEALKALNAPVTEFCTIYFGSNEPADTYLAGVHKFRDAVEQASIEGVHASAIGFTHEDVERDGVKGKGAVLLVGYSSLEAHTAFGETDVFKQNVANLGAGAQKSELHHVRLLKFAAVQ